MTLGYIGLGKMGENMVARFIEKGHEAIEAALSAHMMNQMQPTYQGQLFSVIRNQFGGHSVRDNE